MQDNRVQRLRDRAYGCKVPDPLVEEAADEIERLRPAYATAVQRLASEIARLRLTDKEREALKDCVHACKLLVAYGLDDDDEECARMVSTLRGLLDRTKDGGKCN